jgi:putative sterol carrier protein
MVGGHTLIVFIRLEPDALHMVLDGTKTGDQFMETFKYLSNGWTQEAHRRLRAELTAEKMKFVTSSMVTFYQNCPDGIDRALYYRFVEGIIDEVSVIEGSPPEAEFRISGDYETFAKISRAEMGSRSALMSGKLKLAGNMVKALSLASVVDRMNKVLATIPTEY